MNDVKSSASVVVSEILDVFQDKRGWFMVVEYVGDLEKEIALFLIVKAMLPAKAQFLGHARNAERLTGKARTENVVSGNIRDRHLVNVAVRFLAKIGLVGDLGVFIPIGGEHTGTARALKSNAKTADPAKQINEPKLFSPGISVAVGRRFLVQNARTEAGAF
jgi:hypothetical protein